MQNKTQNKPIILMVDDKPMNLLSLSAAIQDDEFHIVQAGSGNEALGLVLDHDFALILLDVQMPGMDGFETAELIRSNAKTRQDSARDARPREGCHVPFHVPLATP